MDTRKIASELRMSHWAEVMRERQASGLSVKAFCRETDIQQNVYYYWQRKLRETTCKVMLDSEKSQNSTAVVPNGWALCEEEKELVKAEEIVIEVGKFRVRASSDTTPELLTKICTTLVSIC